MGSSRRRADVGATARSRRVPRVPGARLLGRFTQHPVHPRFWSVQFVIELRLLIGLNISYQIWSFVHQILILFTLDSLVLLFPYT